MPVTTRSRTISRCSSANAARDVEQEPGHGIALVRIQVLGDGQEPSRKKATKGPKRATGRHGTKTAKVLALLERPEGATLEQLMTATGWQAHSVRGFLSGAVRKKMGLRLQTHKRDDGERTYRLPAN